MSLKLLKLAVIVSDAQAAAHVGGEVNRTVRVFDLTLEAHTYIVNNRGQPYVDISLALCEDDTP
jgi:hypothetical protein